MTTAGLVPPGDRPFDPAVKREAPVPWAGGPGTSPSCAAPPASRFVVGTCLVALNQGDVLVAAALHGVLSPPPLAWKIPLTYLVPFLVSWHASAAATRAR